MTNFLSRLKKRLWAAKKLFGRFGSSVFHSRPDSYLTPLCLVVDFKMLHALSSSLLTGLATFGLVPNESTSINCSSRRSHLSSARLVWMELYSL